MADVNGAAALKPGIGVFQAIGGTSEGGSATLIGEGVFSANAGISVGATLSPLLGEGIFSASSNAYQNAEAMLLGEGIFSGIAVGTSDAEATMISCAALYAKATISSDELPIGLVGTGMFMATGNFTATTEALVLLGVGKSLDPCYIANVEDYFNEVVELACDTPIDKPYYVHVNRIIEDYSINGKMLMSSKFAPTESTGSCSNSRYTMVTEKGLEPSGNTVNGYNGTATSTFQYGSISEDELGGAIELGYLSWETGESGAYVYYNISDRYDCIDGSICLYINDELVSEVPLDENEIYSPSSVFFGIDYDDTVTVEFRLGEDCGLEP